MNNDKKASRCPNKDDTKSTGSKGIIKIEPKHVHCFRKVLGITF